MTVPIWQELAIQRHTREALLLYARTIDDVDALVVAVARAMHEPVAAVRAVLDGLVASGDLELCE